MGKREIPDLDSGVDEIKFIGKYLTRALNREGIRTCEDLVEKLFEFGDGDENPQLMRREVKEWLEDVLINARSEQCCYPQSKWIEGEECSYKARYMNFKGFNAIIQVMRYYSIPPWRNWIPRPLRGFNERNKYPRECNMDTIIF